MAKLLGRNDRMKKGRILGVRYEHSGDQIIRSRGEEIYGGERKPRRGQGKVSERELCALDVHPDLSRTVVLVSVCAVGTKYEVRSSSDNSVSIFYSSTREATRQQHHTEENASPPRRGSQPPHIAVPLCILTNSGISRSDRRACSGIIPTLGVLRSSGRGPQAVEPAACRMSQSTAWIVPVPCLCPPLFSISLPLLVFYLFNHFFLHF